MLYRLGLEVSSKETDKEDDWKGLGRETEDRDTGSLWRLFPGPRAWKVVSQPVGIETISVPGIFPTIPLPGILWIILSTNHLKGLLDL